ncbi:MAG: DNA polymerase III subunit epsilon [Ponticaulis sp.]|nr:DNA polymerase III subunit epsilon [Ponticaulis sp.]
MRQIMFDVETTGLFHDQGDRIIEIGAVECLNFMPTGETFQAYVDPGRSVSKETIEITGITDDDLVGKPKFESPDIVDKLLTFIGDGEIVAHNAKFDHGFLNMELKRAGYDQIPYERWIDSAAVARSKFPGSPASLDALCKRFNINSDARTFHGALLDSQLLAEVWLELNGGRHRTFSFDGNDGSDLDETGKRRAARQRPNKLQSRLTNDEISRHREFIAGLSGNSRWFETQAPD